MNTLTATRTAKDVMTRDVQFALADWPLDRLAEFLTENGFSGAPVVDETGALVGVVSLSDLVQHESLPDSVPWTRSLTDYFRHDDSMFDLANQYGEEELELFRVEGDTMVTVGDIMTRVTFSVDPDTPIHTLAEMMVGGQIHRLLVTRGDRLEGVISSLDLLKVLCEA